MNTFTELLSRLWPLWLLIAHLGGAVAVTIHALLHKREVASVTGWIGLAWLAPVIGPVLYLILGVNRIQRKGIALGLHDVWDHREAPEKIREDEMRTAELSRRYPTFVGLARLGEQVTGHPILPGNAVEPLVNGDEAYPQMLAAIDEATTSVNLLSYIFDSDRSGDQFLAALKRACARGVEVRVLIDSVGAAYSKPNMADRLKKEGVPVAEFLPARSTKFLPFANMRNHRKILVADGKLGFTGGTNIRVDHCLDLKPVFPVQCLHFRVEGPVVAELQEAFAIDWAFATGETLAGPTWFPKIERRGPVGARGIPDGPDEDLDKISEVILGALSVADRVDQLGPAQPAVELRIQPRVLRRNPGQPTGGDHRRQTGRRSACERGGTGQTDAAGQAARQRRTAAVALPVNGASSKSDPGTPRVDSRACL